ncbi:1-aminocyclopropane-1-carboxylate deaminase/D-cysteine desulfhydrase [Pseudonocardia sp. CA-107938]|uniref:1-aminocyclopropane-1-carboxylate deaminase/D-cysteine desulfhydrase n=1 Tax=Pseudonocardia sp. CA-107938 TaxID=3240021 RepID=UPI003D8E8AD1
MSSMSLALPSPLADLVDERLGGVSLALKRDDLIAPVISGNKFRKLRYLEAEVRRAGATTVLTFGGAYSNHLRAVAAWGRLAGVRTIGVVRGEERPYNSLLAACVDDGMTLEYLDRRTYRRKTDPSVIDELRAVHGDFHLLPEGGTSASALRGCAELVAEIERPFDLLVTPVGTGGTLAGVAAGIGPGQRALGISVLRGAEYLNGVVDALHVEVLGERLGNWSIDHRFHHGGYAKRSELLDEFLGDMTVRHGLSLDHVYVGKMLYALFDMAASGEIASGTQVVAVVTGSPAQVVPAPTRPT